jgi:outer membrane biosynthesis protein TonB
MKRAFLLIVVPALLIALGFAQTPPASSNTDQTNIKGCLGGSDGNYTVVEDKTGLTFKITTSSVDLKAHLGHDVTLMGHRASGTSPAAAENSFAVTELNLISEHCAAAAVAPAATVSTLPETGVTPVVAPTPPAETAVIPAAPAAIVSTPAETAVIPAVPAVHPTRLPAPPQKRPAPPAAATTKPAMTASTPSELVSTAAADAPTPVATASTSSEPASTPAAVATPPVAPAKRGSLWLLIAFAVVVVVLGILVPSISRWRKQRLVERTGAQNLSFNREASFPDQTKNDQSGPRKVA